MQIRLKLVYWSMCSHNDWPYMKKNLHMSAFNSSFSIEAGEVFFIVLFFLLSLLFCFCCSYRSITDEAKLYHTTRFPLISLANTRGKSWADDICPGGKKGANIVPFFTYICIPHRWWICHWRKRNNTYLFFKVRNIWLYFVLKFLP